MPPSAWPVNYMIWGSQQDREYCSTWSQNTLGHQNCQNCQQFSAPFRSHFGPIITIVESWQHVHLKDQVLSFKTNGHLWKSVKNWLEKLAKSNAISKHVTLLLPVYLKCLVTVATVTMTSKGTSQTIIRPCSWALLPTFTIWWCVRHLSMEALQF